MACSTVIAKHSRSEQDGVCESPRDSSGQHWVEEPEQAEVSPWRTVYGDSLQFYLVLGSTAQPVVTPKGITVNEDPKGAWASLSISCDELVLPAIQHVDNRIRQLLADNSGALFGMKCTPDMVATYKFYTPARSSCF